MHVDIRHSPAFAALFVTFDSGDSIIAESDAMISHSSGVKMATKMRGGFISAVMRKIFGGESLFINTFSAPGREGSMVLSQAIPGDICELTLKGETICLQPGAFIASDATVKMEMGWAGFASWFNGEGLFRIKVSGYGKLYFGGYGALVRKEVDGDYRVDSGHLIAYEPTLKLRLKLSGGIFSSFFGGEGVVTNVRGRGCIYMQSRSISGLASWTNRYLRS